MANKLRSTDDLVLTGKATSKPTKDHTYHGYLPKTAEENWVFNTKKPIPAGWEIIYKDGNPNNWMYSNLMIEPKRGEAEPVKEEPKEEPKKAKK